MTDVVTVFGASGFIGTYVVRALCARGMRVRAAVRRPHIANDLRVLGTPGQVQLVQANVRNRPSVARAVEGADAVINLVGVLFESGRQKFRAVQTQGARNVAEAAKAAGIDRLVHVSAIGADPDANSDYARTKGLGEAAVREAFPAASIIRPSIVFGPEDEFFNKFANMFRYTPAFVPIPILMHGGKTRFQPVYVRDVAEAIARVIERPETAGKTFELGGPQIYTFKELLKYTLEEIDRPRFLLPAPGIVGYLIALAGELVGATPFWDPPITRDQVRLLKHDNIVNAEGGVLTLADLGIAPDTVEAIAPSYLERYRRYGQFHESAA
ncbi:MAG: complex I NDUFA9 subunit family protein [Maricaulaceae bacterium]|jgi:NADH dehydrogenase